MDFRKLMGMICALYWFCGMVIIVPTACVATLCVFVYPTMLFSMSLFNRLEHALCRMVNDHWVSAGQYTGVNVVEYGDDISAFADKRSLVLCNHLGLIDHFCLMTAFHNKRSVAGSYLWVIFNIWKYTPLGLMWTAHGNFFINGGRSAKRREEMLQGFRAQLKANYWKHEHGWVVMYPEGSRLFLIKDAEKRFCHQNQLKPFVHCAHPRTSAAHSALMTCASKGKSDGIEYVIDCTLGYPKGVVGDLSTVMLGDWPNNDTTIALHYRVHRVRREWLESEEKFRQWLYDQYQAKDEMLGHFYKTGRFPSGGKGRQVQFSLQRSVLVQLFWLALFYFHYGFWMRPLAVWGWRMVFL